MEVLTVKEVKEAEARAVAAGLSEDILIENAAAALKEAVLSLYIFLLLDVLVLNL